MIEGRLTGIQDQLTGVGTRLTGVEGRLTLVEDKLTDVGVRLTGVEGRLTGASTDWPKNLHANGNGCRADNTSLAGGIITVVAAPRHSKRRPWSPVHFVTVYAVGGAAV